MHTNSESRAAIIAALIAKKDLFEGSEKKYALSLGINPSVYSRLKNGETEKVMSEAEWLRLARRLAVSLRNEFVWQAAPTAVYNYIHIQLNQCQYNAFTRILVDAPGTGKTFSAKEYCASQKNALYVDCSQIKSRQRLIRFIAKSFGADSTGRYADVYDDLCYTLRQVAFPLIVLDEAGDLDYPAFLELKALWNATERHCGWYMMGSDGLRSKIEKGIAHKKVGFTEIFNRYGSKYGRITPAATEERQELMFEMAIQILETNYPDCQDMQKLVTASGHHLRTIADQVIKNKSKAV